MGLSGFARSAAIPRAPQAHHDAAATPLTERELDVLRLVARGQTNAESCNDLFVSLGTVKTHLASVQAELGLTNRVQVAA